MILTKDEVVKMARQVWPEVSAGAPMPDGLERFTTLCRAPLVAEVERLTADLEQTRVQLAGCGVAAMQNTEESKANRVERGAYGWSASYGDVCRMVDREIELRAERDAAIERADELGADKGTYFRLYEQACIQMTEKDKYGEHYRTLFNNADEANNRLIDERDALRAELGQYPEIQAMLMSENKQLRAEVEALERLLESVIGVDQVSAVNDARTAIAAGQQYLKENGK